MPKLLYVTKRHVKAAEHIFLLDLRPETIASIASAT
jgi:hypothetical protein